MLEMRQPLPFLSLVALALAFSLIVPSKPVSSSETLVQVRANPERKREADRLFLQGSEQIKARQLETAFQTLQQALVIYQEISDRRGEGKTLGNIGWIYQNQNNPERAIEYYQQALAIAREISDSEIEVTALKHLARVYTILKEYSQAIEYRKQLLALARGSLNRELELETLLALRIAYVRLQDHQNVIDIARQQLAVLRETAERSPWEFSSAFGAIIEAHQALGNSYQGIEFIQQQLSLARETQNITVEFAALDVLSNVYQSSEDYEKVIELGRQQLALVPDITWESQNIWRYSVVLRKLLQAYQAIGNYQTGIEIAQQQLALAREMESDSLNLESVTLGVLTEAYQAINDYQKVVEIAKQHLELARIQQNGFQERAAIEVLVKAYRSLGDYQSAIDMTQQYLTIARKEQNHLAEHQALFELADIYQALDEYERSTEFIQESLTIAREREESFWEARALIALGKTYDILANYPKALELTQQGLAASQVLQNRNLEAAALIILGSAYDSLEDYPRALGLAQQGLVLARELKNRDLEAWALAELSDIYYSLKEHQEALEAARQSLEIAREIESPSRELSAMLNLSAVYFDLGDYEESATLSQQSLAMAREIKQSPTIEAVSLFFLAAHVFAEGNYQKTINLAEQTLAVLPEFKNLGQVNTFKMPILLLLSLSHGGLSDYEKAEELARESLAIAREQQSGEFKEFGFTALGSIYRKSGQKERAIASYREALAVAAEREITGSGALALVGLARLYRDANMPIAAITYYKQVINEVEQLRGNIRGLPSELQKSFLQSVQFDLDRTQPTDAYRELADLLLSQGRILEAQEVLELLKVQELRDFTHNRRAGDKLEVQFNDTETQIKREHGTLIAFGQKVVECEETSCQELNRLLDQLDNLTAQFNQTVRILEERVRERLSQDRAILDPQDFGREALEIVEAQPGTVLIYPLVLENKLWLLWAAKGGIVKSVELEGVGQRQLGETVLKFRQLLQDPTSNITELQATGKQLYDWLIQPIAPELKANQIQNLVFSLDRATRYIPMGALFDGEQYLIEQYTVSTILSADLTDMSNRLPLRSRCKGRGCLPLASQ